MPDIECFKSNFDVLAKSGLLVIHAKQPENEQGGPIYEIKTPSGGRIDVTNLSGDYGIFSPSGDWFNIFDYTTDRWMAVNPTTIECIDLGPAARSGAVNNQPIWHQTNDQLFWVEGSDLVLRDLNGNQIGSSVALSASSPDPEGNPLLGAWFTGQCSDSTTSFVSFIQNAAATVAPGFHQFIQPFDKFTGALVGSGWWLYNETSTFASVHNPHCADNGLYFLGTGGGVDIHLVPWLGGSFSTMAVPADESSPNVHPTVANPSIVSYGVDIGSDPVLRTMDISDMANPVVLCDYNLRTIIGGGTLGAPGYFAYNHGHLMDDGTILFSVIDINGFPEGLYLADPLNCSPIVKIVDMPLGFFDFERSTRPSGNSNWLVWHEDEGTGFRSRVCFTPIA